MNGICGCIKVCLRAGRESGEPRVPWKIFVVLVRAGFVKAFTSLPPGQDMEAPAECWRGEEEGGPEGQREGYREGL